MTILVADRLRLGADVECRLGFVRHQQRKGLELLLRVVSGRQRALGEAMRTGHLQPGDYGAVASTHSGTGPGNYVFDNTQVVRIKPEDCIYGMKVDNGKLIDAAGKVVPLQPGKVVMVRASVLLETRQSSMRVVPSWRDRPMYC